MKKRISESEVVQENPWVQELLKCGRIRELDRATVVKLVKCIEVFEDRTIKISYNFSDGFDYLLEQ